jgi:hypothetical protein
MDFTQTLKKKFSKIRKNGSVVFGNIVEHMLNNNQQFFFLNFSFVFFLSLNVEPCQKNLKFWKKS